MNTHPTPALHHWWPRSLSKEWEDENGDVHWLSPDGKVVSAPPAQFGAIRDGHAVRLGPRADKPTPWDYSFESEFDLADRSFQEIVPWLESTRFSNTFTANIFKERWRKTAASDARLRTLTECAVSLVVRSPMFREKAVAWAEHLRGTIEKRERNKLIAANISRCQRSISSNLGANAKFAILHSINGEYIYGDGCYSNLSPADGPLYDPQFLVAITPKIAVAVIRPPSRMVQPKLVTMHLGTEWVDAVNIGTMVYSKKCLFYRTRKPEKRHEFTGAVHMCFASSDNLISQLLRSIPGVD